MIGTKSQIEKDIQRIKDAKTFDEAWYLRTYKEVGLLNMDPIEHYVKYGEAMGRHQNSALFEKAGEIRATDIMPPERLDFEHQIEQNTELHHVPYSYGDLTEISKRRDQGRALDATALRMGSLKIRNLFAWQALNRQGNLDVLLSALGGLRDLSFKQQSAKLLRSADRFWLSRLARILALQNIRVNDRTDALAIYKFLFTEGDHKDLYKGSAKIFFDIALSINEYDLARRVLGNGGFSSDEQFYSKVDLANPSISKGAPYQKWLASFNKVFQKTGAESISIALDKDLPLLDSIVCNAPVRSIKGPKVTVVISVWEPNQDLRTSVQSIIDQTWENLEIFLVDDACDPKFYSIIQDCVNMDGRIRLLRAEVNRGTYAARNLAIKNATGAFMTFQDSDDWSHPRRIEKQVSELLSNPRLIANTCRTVRTNNDLVFSYVGYPNPRRLNTSSLMFRLEEVVEKIGFFDAVRKGADTEFVERLKAAFGVDTYQQIPDVLSIVRVGHDSLSRVDFKPGFHHPARTSYKGGYMLWHNKIREGSVSPYMSDNQNVRSFPVPDRFNVDKDWVKGVKRRHYDVILVGDWRKDGGPQNSMLMEIAAFKNSGYTVAILHMEAVRFMTSAMGSISIKAQHLLNSGAIDQICIDDHVDTDLLLFRYPPILQFPSALSSNVRAQSGILVVNQAPHELDGSDIRYETHNCIENAKEIFGIDPIWSPQGPLVRDMVADLLPAQLVAQEDIVGFIDPEAWAPVRAPLSGNKPVLGKYSRDDPMKFPLSKDVLLACYPDDNTFDVRIMGGKAACKKLLGTDVWPANWTMYNHGEKPSKDFLDEIDFFVHFDNPSIVEAFGRSILEAIASGRVTILPEKFKRVFGEAAVYCKPQDVAGVITDFWTDPDKYREQSEIAIKCVREKFSSESFLGTIRRLAPNLIGAVAQKT